MLTVDKYARIRQLRREGCTFREIAQQLGHSPKTILKVLGQSEPPARIRMSPRAAPIFGPFQAFVDAIMKIDETAPRKQRHTAAQIYRRLVAEHGYRGQYDQIRRYLRQRRLDDRETFIPLDHRPGRRAEADFGHIYVDYPDGRRLVPVLIVTWSYSNAPFALALPTERTEAILHGLVEAFAFFDAVPDELWWDNPTTVAVQILIGRERVLHSRYAALVSHYPFTAKFCLPATPQEKPRVENRVKDLERQWATPVPQVKDLAELNAHLRRCCLQARERCCGTNTETVGARFAQDRAAALPVPERPFEACVWKPATVDKYQTAAFDGNRYSVPRRWAFQAVTIKGFVDRIEIVAEGTVVATHPRSYAKHEKVLNPLHYLVVLTMKPAALDHAPVYRDWQLPPAFAALRKRLESRLGHRAGARQYIRVLQLLARHPLAVVEQAIHACADADATKVTTFVEQLTRHVGITNDASTYLAVTVPRPDLARFNLFLSPFSEGDANERSTTALAQSEPQAAQAADHPGRAREVGPRSRNAG
jgi:transposase